MALIDEQKSTAEPPVEVEVRESLLESIASMSVVLVIGLFVMTFIFQNFVIPSASMVKTLLIGDHVLVDRTTLAPQTKWMPLVHYRSAKRGDIIVNGVAHNEAYAAMPAYDGDPNADRPRLSYVFQTSTPSKSSVLQSLGSAASQRTYRFAIDDFISWYCSEPRLAFGRTVVLRYRYELESRQLAPATINLRLAAVRRLAYEASDNGLLSPDLAAGIRRVKGAKRLGMRLGNWLTPTQGKKLLGVSDRDSVKGKRNYALLAILLGCGLRRSELTRLTVSHLQQRDDHWAIIDLFGKGGHVRTVPVPAWVKVAVDTWLAIAGIETGTIFRCVSRTGRVWGNRLSEKAVWWVVREYAKLAGIDNLAPHDLRRTCARLCHSSGGELEQIQFLLGHRSVETTERYLGSRQRLVQAVNDHLGIEPQGGSS